MFAPSPFILPKRSTEGEAFEEQKSASLELARHDLVPTFRPRSPNEPEEIAPSTPVAAERGRGIRILRRELARSEEPSDEVVRSAAVEGVRTPAAALPFLDRIQTSFYPHPVGHIKAHDGAEATHAARAMNARAFASGGHLVFGNKPDLHTAAHEAAHVIQQRAGVQLAGGIGREGDAYEHHADAVADAVVAGLPVAGLLAPFATGLAARPLSTAPWAVQRKVGFEFQTGVHVVGTKNLTEGDEIGTGNGWYVVADEVKGRRGDLEFVTDPFEEERPLTRTVSGAQAAAQKIDDLRAKDSQGPSPLCDFVAKADVGITVEHPTSEVTAAPQATYDVPLELVTTLLQEQVEPQLGSQFGGDPTDERTWSLSGESPEEAQILANCAALIEDWGKRNLPNPNHYHRLMGLASLILSYVINAARQDKTKSLPYAKLIAPVMSRTSFSSLWEQLSSRERAVFDESSMPEITEEVDEENDYVSEEEEVGEEEEEEEEEEDPAANNFSNWMLNMADLYAQRFNVPEKEQASWLALFPAGYRSEGSRTKVDGPTLPEWFRSIVAPDKSGKDLLSPPEHGSLSMGEKTAVTPTAMLELRRLPKNLPVSAWTDFARHIFGLYSSLVRPPEIHLPRRAQPKAKDVTGRRRDIDRRRARAEKYQE